MIEIKGSKGFFINSDLKIKKPRLFAENIIINGTLTITIKETKITKRLSWWYLIALYGIDIEKHLDKIDFIKFVKINPLRTNWPIDKFPIYTGNKRYENDFKWLPHVSDYAVSEDGRIYSLINNRELSPYTDAFGYLMVTLMSRLHDRQRNFRVHRLVAEAWVKNPDWYTNDVVNHLDTNRQNPHRSNLEWSNDKDNNQHSSDFGNNPLTKRCIVINHLTGIETLFESIQSACSKLGIKYSRQMADLRVPRLKPFLGKYEFKLEGSTEPWQFSGKRLSVKKNKPIVIRFIDKIEEFKSIKDLKRYFGINNGVNGRFDTPSILKHIKATRPDVVEIKTQPCPTYEVRHIGTGIVTFGFKTYKSITDFIKAPSDAVRISINKNNQVDINGYQVRVKSNAPWKTPKEIKIIKARKVLLLNVATGEEILFPSLTKVSRYLKADRSNLTATYLNKQKLWKDKYLLQNP